MSTIEAPAIHDLFSGSFPALAPAAADVDRPRLMRRLKAAARGTRDASDPLVEHLRRDGFHESNLIPYTHRAFDTRWLYIDPGADRDYLAHVAADVPFVGIGGSGDAPMITHRAAAELDAPLQLFPLTRVRGAVKTPNFTGEASEFIRRTGIGESDLFHHAIAILSAPHTVTPRIPLPEAKNAIRDSALLGYRVASLFAEHDPLVPVTNQEQALRAFGVPSRIGKEARMLRGSVLRVDERWASSEMIVPRIYKGDELVAVSDCAHEAGMSGDEALSILGRQTCDVYLNDKALWRNVPIEVWRYTHRGVPLLRAWLRDRHLGVLDRGLMREEVTHFSMAVRRIAALLLLQPALTKNASH
jgi:hypothetical protein